VRVRAEIRGPIRRWKNASDEFVEELAGSEQALEAAAVDEVGDAADHPERPVPTHEEYGRPDDVHPRRRKRDAARKTSERELSQACSTLQARVFP
jgi:hypothetical protein